MIAENSIKAIKLVIEADQAGENLNYNQTYFRNKMKKVGFDLIPEGRPIILIMLYDEKKLYRWQINF